MACIGHSSSENQAVNGEFLLLLLLLILSTCSGTSLFCHLLLWLLWLCFLKRDHNLVQQLQIFLALVSFLLVHLHLLSLEMNCVKQAHCQFYTHFPCLKPSWVSDGSLTAALLMYKSTESVCKCPTHADV